MGTDWVARFSDGLDPFTPTETLATLSRDEDARVRKAVAGNPSTPTADLWRLARDSHQDVRLAVAGNEYAPLEALAALAEDRASDVRGAVAMNQSTPVQLLSTLIGDPDPGIRGWLAMRDLLHVDLDRLCFDEHPAVRKQAREFRAIRRPFDPLTPPAAAEPPRVTLQKAAPQPVVAPPHPPPALTAPQTHLQPSLPAPPAAQPMHFEPPLPRRNNGGRLRAVEQLLDAIGPLPRVIVAILGVIVVGLIALALLFLVAGVIAASFGAIALAIMVATLAATVYGAARIVHKRANRQSAPPSLPPPPPRYDSQPYPYQEQQLHNPNDLR